MKTRIGFGFFLSLLIGLRTVSWSLNVDSLPVWNEPQNKKNLDALLPIQKDTLKLATRGSKTIQVVVGDGGTQVDQELRLSIQGEIAPSVYIDALLSDVGRSPGDQNTATLQEVDQIYFRVESPHVSLHLGDFSWKQESLGLLGLERASLGLAVGLRRENVEVRGAYGTDEINRETHLFKGVDGQRRGYVVSQNGIYQTIVPGSENVWFNGNALIRDRDYQFNYAGGVLDFIGEWIPGSQDEIQVEYDSYAGQSISVLRAFEGRYRSKNIWFDVGGFRLASDVDRLKRSAWSAVDFETLKNDLGGVALWSDSLGNLERPEQTDRMSARLRAQVSNRWFLDAEVAYQEKDTNTVSDAVNGPLGRASRWFLSSDTSAQLLHFPLALSVYGNYFEDGFLNALFQGSDRDWNSYVLNEEWDLDSASLSGSLRHDHLFTQWRLPWHLFSGVEMGYRQSADSSLWNSSRGRFFLEHRHKKAKSSLALVRVASSQVLETERYQGLLEAKFLEGVFRPFGSGSYSFWNKDSSGHLFYSDRLKTGAGFEAGNLAWQFSEDLLTQQSKRGYSKKALQDSLRLWQWTQKFSIDKKTWNASNLLRYKNSWTDSLGSANSWLGETSFHSNQENSGWTISSTYELGLTNEQAYVPIYKAVAPGTGDVFYDSLTGNFIEDVDNGNFMYEGMGRVDSLGAVKASTAAMDAKVEWSPAKMFAIQKGFLRDVSFSAQGHFEGRDTTGNTIYTPPFRKKTLHSISSGLVHYEGAILWSLPSGKTSLTYSLGAEDEKKNFFYNYFQNRRWHSGDLFFTTNDRNHFSFSIRKEDVDLESIQQMNWALWDFKGSWKRRWISHLSLEPGGFFRYGNGGDEVADLNLFLKQGSLKVYWDQLKMASAFALFSATHVSTKGQSLPYQMNSGFAKGLTYRFEANASVDLNDYVSFSLRYVLRFGNAEEKLFQKWTTEAKAYF